MHYILILSFSEIKYPAVSAKENIPDKEYMVFVYSLIEEGLYRIVFQHLSSVEYAT